MPEVELNLHEKASQFPSLPGVYLMKDALGRVLYVGKANDLRKRVSSYFWEREDRYQIRFLMKRVAAIDTIVTDSEKEALLLENTLIKKHKPRYNLQLRDDKKYLSLKLSIKDRFPRLYVTRQIRKDGSIYFGPFTSAASARETMEYLEKYFRLRTCSDMEFANRVRPCLQYQIHRCDAPCVGKIGEEDYRKIVDQVRLFLQGRKTDLLEELEQTMQLQSKSEEFEKASQTRDLILSIRETLQRQKVDRHVWLNQDVVGFAREGENGVFSLMMIREGKVWDTLFFYIKGDVDEETLVESFMNQYYATEEDRILPDEVLVPRRFSSLEVLQEILTDRGGKTVKILVPQRGDRNDLVELAAKNAQQKLKARAGHEIEMQEILAKLQAALSLENYPRRMECFDISNTGGQQSVGSLVSFTDGMPDKSGYRRFKIRWVEGPDDFAMMQEVLGRCFSHLEKEDPHWIRPDLLVIDGGKGQLNAVLAVMQEMNVTGIDVISLAKEKKGETQDKVFLPGRKNPVLLGRHSNLLYLLMRIRDEAHRFAITYHKKLRSKAFLSTTS